MSVGLDIQLRTILSLIYRKGPVSTGIALDSLAAETAGDSLVVTTQLERGGNGAWIGNAVFTLADSSGVTVREWLRQVAVYRSDTRRTVLPLDGVAPGRYRLRVELNTERDDVDRRHILPAPPVFDSLAVAVP